MIPIIQNDNPVLRQKAREIKQEEFGTPWLSDIITRMKKALQEQNDGVAIAAPQIGEPIRIFIVSGKVFSSHYPDLKESEVIQEDFVCINPKLIKLSKRKKKMTEGCLSVRWLYGNVERSTQATIEAQDESGKTFTRGGSGLLAQIFQHETDHLEGILFIDNATDIEEMLPEEQK